MYAETHLAIVRKILLGRLKTLVSEKFKLSGFFAFLGFV